MVVNLISFYLAWWSVLFFAKKEQSFLIIVVFILYFIIHYYNFLKNVNFNWSYLLHFLLFVGIGISSEYIFHYFNVYTLKKDYLVWTLAIWPIFVSTFSLSLKKLFSLNIFSLVLLSAVGGPFSYLGASQFEIIDYPIKPLTLIVHGIFWSLYFIFVKMIRRKYEEA